MKIHYTVFAFSLLAACSSARQSAPVQPAAPEAPWQTTRLASTSVPGVYVQQWNAAPNRATCALLAFANVAGATGATPRAATFSGGWAVAYDLPETRSAFGIAGTGATPSPDTYSDWPFKKTWSDGSTAGYGPEGGTGPNQLAYLTIPGQACLYNVWSRLGRAHLESLLDAIRFVQLP